MSIRVMSDVWDLSESTGSARLVLLAIADSCDHDGTNAWPAIETIAKKTKVSRSTVQRAVKDLVGLGELRVVPGPSHIRSDRRPNGYEISFSRGFRLTPRDGTGCQSDTHGVSSDAPRGVMGDTQPVLTQPDSLAISGFFENARKALHNGD
jgi:hypothetical protein